MGTKDCRTSKIGDNELLSCEHFLRSDDGTLRWWALSMQLALMCGTLKLLMEIEMLIMASVPLQEKMIY